METAPNAAAPGFLAFMKERWAAALLIAVSYIALTWLSGIFLPHPGTLFPASAVALSGLFLEGLLLWPVVYIAALIGGALLSYPPEFLIMMPVAQTLQAFLGAYLLRKANIDPLFRRSRDIFYLTGILIFTSLVVPVFGSLTDLFAIRFFGHAYPLAALSLRYTGTLFCLLIVTPLLLRWFSKSRFNRTYKEIIETVIVFAFLIGFDYTIFIKGIGAVKGIPLVYFLLIPLFWIALRLRPRFVTLALLITSLFAIGGLYAGAFAATPDLFPLRLFQTEEFLIVIALIFLNITSLEEDRRLSSNLLRSQVATLENAVSRISSESSAKNDFIAMLAHELRNPLAPIASSIELLTLKGGHAEEEAALLAVMEERMQTVRRILDDLLDISRVTEGKVSLKKERVDIGTCVRRAITSTMHHVAEHHQSLTLELPEEPLYIEGDPVRIEQVFSNLLTNASKYSGAGAKISIEARKRDDTAEIVVTDTGSGIKAKDLENIFIPFHQVERSGAERKGLGIGLGLVRSFVGLHKGSVRAESEGPGKGSRFIVSLPLSAGPAAPVAPVAPGIPETRKSREVPLVLIVDDNDAAAASMGKLLELKGCSALYAYDGRQGVEQAEAFSPDVILLDIGLPDYDGYTVAKMIRAQGFKGRLIALTGYSTEDARAKGANSGFDHYLIKPAGIADLKRVIPEIA